VDAIMNVLHMGGYAAYVWPAYGLAFVGMVGILVFTRRTLKAREREFETLKNARRGGRE
jgi:heme exporter protein D